MILNLNNVEEIVFYDKALQKKLPEFRHLFDYWQVAQMSPGLKSMTRRTALDLLKQLSSEHVKTIEEHIEQIVFVEAVDDSIVKLVDCHIDSLESQLADNDHFNNFSVYRNNDQVRVCLWR